MSETENMDRTVTEDGGQPGQITEADIDGVEDNRDGQTEGVGEPGATPNPANDEDDRDNREMDVAAGRRNKTRAKTAFTKARHGLLAAIANSFTPSEIDGCTAELDERMEVVLGVMDELAALLEHQRNREAADRIVTEMEKIEEEYSAAQDRAAEYCEEYRLRERRRDRPRSGLRQRQRYDEQPSSSEEEQNNDQRGRVDRTPDLVVVERPALAAADREHRDAFNSAVTRDSTSGHESRSPRIRPAQRREPIAAGHVRLYQRSSHVRALAILLRALQPRAVPRAASPIANDTLSPHSRGPERRIRSTSARICGSN